MLRADRVATIWPEWFLSPVSAVKRLLCQDVEGQLVKLAVEGLD